jgi:hypothetical protein
VVLRLFIGEEHVAPQPHRVVEGLEAGRKLRPLVFPEVAGLSAQRDDEVVVGELAVAQRHFLRGKIDAGHVGEQHREVGLLAQDAADGRGDVGRGQRGGGHLVEQGLEDVVVLAVDDRDAGQVGRKLLRKGQAAEAGTEDDDVRELGIHG